MSRGFKQCFIYLALCGFVVFSLLPMYLSLIPSLRPPQALFSKSVFLPDFPRLTLENYVKPFKVYPLWHYFGNSFLIASLAAAMGLFIAIPAAYSLTRLRFPGRRALLGLTISTIMFPWIALVIPIYDAYVKLHLLNTYPGLILLYAVTVLPLAIWLLYGFFKTGVDKNVEEAAMVDGCSQAGAFFRVILPCCTPALAAVTIFTFLMAWTDFEWVFLLTSGESKRTATVALHYMVGVDAERNWSVIMATTMLVALPPAILYTFLQKFMVRGFARGAGVKG